MGKWIYREGKREPLSNYFRSYFFAGFLFHFIGLMSSATVKYYDDQITKAKWLGVITGFGFNIAGIVLPLILSSIIENKRIAGFFWIGILLAGFLFGVLYKYKEDSA